MKFTEWLDKEQKLIAAGVKVEKERGEAGPFTDARDAMEIAWDAACEERGTLVEQLAEALRQYADADNWRLNRHLNPESASFDGLSLARAALAKLDAAKEKRDV